MKFSKTLPIAMAASLATFLLAGAASALPAAPTLPGIAASQNLVDQAKWKQKHGKVKAKHWNRGNHYGWSRGRGHKYGLRKQSRYAY